MMDKRGGPISGQPNFGSGFMPGQFQGTLFRPVGTPILNLKGPDSSAIQRAQLDLLAKLNEDHLALRPGGAELVARAQSYELAYRMQAEAPEAVDLATESQKLWICMALARNPLMILAGTV